MKVILNYLMLPTVSKAATDVLNTGIEKMNYI